MKIREHRGSLDDSLQTVAEIEPTREAVAEHVARALSAFLVPVTPAMIQVTEYSKDDRIGWDTYIVTVDGYGVFGFTDGPLRGASDDLSACGSSAARST